mmetsp:Transcript_18629/g.46504  ORF Transcript_18629/g.46504 Transcript_18629/m.46504 type:complete len:158 (-) Transcript_18629:238-711(-)
MNWIMLEKMPTFIAKVRLCENCLDAAVFSPESPEKSPASSSGQHQLPTSAGAEHNIVATAQRVDFRSASSRATSFISSSSSSRDGSARPRGRGPTLGGPAASPNSSEVGGPQSPVAQSSPGWLIASGGTSATSRSDLSQIRLPRDRQERTSKLSVWK